MINKGIANESFELGKKNLHADAEQKLLGIVIDKNLKFQFQTKSIIKSAFIGGNIFVQQYIRAPFVQQHQIVPFSR